MERPAEVALQSVGPAAGQPSVGRPAEVALLAQPSVGPAAEAAEAAEVAAVVCVV